MSKRKTHDEFIVEMKTKHPNIDVLGKYETSKSKILCTCKIDGYEWYPVAYSLSMGNGCPKCAGNAKKTHEEFLFEINNINPNIEILGKYINNSTKLLCACKLDGYKWEALPNNLLSGKGCPICGGTLKMSHNDFELKMKEIHPNILLVNKYINNKTKIKCKCLIDDYEWEALPNNLLKGCGCHKCSNKTRRTHYEFVEELKKIHPNIEIQNRFTIVHSPVKCLCIKCKNEFYSLSTNLLKGHGCSVCASSKGEERISMYLRNKYIKYKPQKYFKDLFGVGGGYLKYDFYIPDYNLLIEYNGEQHYKPINIFGGEEKFKIQQEHDKRKRKYAENNGFLFLEIGYWDFDNIENILNKYLKEVA